MVDPLRVPAPPSLRRWADAHGYSSEILARWDAFYPDVIGLVEALERPPRRYIRLNALKGRPEKTLKRLEGKGFELGATPLPEAWEILSEPMTPGATDEYLQGRYQIQDLSTQLAVMALDAEPGQRVFDLAAAPGGKTIQIAQAMRNTGSIHAFEIDPERGRALRSNLARCGVLNTAVHVRNGEDARQLGTADRVLVDAPCTGEGVIQRDPTRKRGQLEEYARCARDQHALLAAAADTLAPDGILVYSTCTLAPEENELQVAKALEELPLRLEPLPPAVADLRLHQNPLTPGLTQIAGRQVPDALASTVHTLPHLHGCLGFFLARLRKEDP